ncbi:MAG: hypothetical protein ACFCU4_09410 [Puniceicoccaceae bacterium]
MRASQQGLIEGKLLGFSLVLSLSAGSLSGGLIELGGTDATGYLAGINFKNWTNEPDPVTQSPYPYFFNSSTNVWTTIVAEPLSPTSIYPQSGLPSFTDPGNSSPDFATRSAGQIEYDDFLVSGTGLEVIGVGDLQLTIDGGAFSSNNSPFNVNNNFSFTYNIAASNLTGGGATFNNGALVSVDLQADISIQFFFGDGTNPFFALASPYEGTLGISGSTYAFSVDDTRTQSSLFGPLTDTRIIFNRTGTIPTVIPEPGTIPLAALSLLLLLRRQKRVA